MELNRILLISPRILLQDSARHVNIYRNFPPLDEFFNAVSRYGGQLTIVHGDNDRAVGIHQSEGLYKCARTEWKKLSIVPADHSFSGNSIELYAKEHLIAFR